ncbi:MAG: WYL domain-containing protein [Leptospiraceae bacterium]|nr:WYL domain-containing protein [Leptospiraceae bacterium]MCK6379981.1 WYL domain-containing protein [Leptospiraceae bacterium]NUM40058.1 WYL domain-containing protein [Leptospiraceae bacterium]
MKQKTKKVREKLNLIKILSSKRLTLDELAKYSGYTKISSLKNDLSELYMIGSFPYSPGDYIEIDYDGNTVGIRLPTKLDLYVRLSADEWMELRNIIDEELKIEFNDERKKYLRSVQEKIKKIIPYSEYEPRYKLKEQIQDAINKKNKIQFNYQSRKNNLSEKREVAPFRIIQENSGYLIAYCYLRKDLRIFRIDSIFDIVEIGTSYESDLMEMQSTEYDLSFSNISTSNKEEAEILFLPEIEINLSLRMKFIVKERNIILDNENKYIRATTSILEENWFKNTIRSFGKNIIVLKPESIREEFVSDLEKFQILKNT